MLMLSLLTKPPRQLRRDDVFGNFCFIRFGMTNYMFTYTFHFTCN